MEHQVAETERDLLALPVRMDGLGLVNPVNQSRQKYEASIKSTGPLVKQIAKKKKFIESSKKKITYNEHRLQIAS